MNEDRKKLPKIAGIDFEFFAGFQIESFGV
jgi:hypothetical protein